MTASCISVLFLIFSLSTSAEPQEHQITAGPGDDVTLPCRAPNYVTIRAVEWIRADPERLVYLKSDGRLNTADQDPSYVNRVKLKDDEMTNGELSLILKNVNNKDEGKYECRYVEETATQMKLISIVILNAGEPQEHQITAKPGDDVTLSCEAPNNVNITAVEWIRSDLERHVYLKIDGHLVTAYQDPSYVNRVQLKDGELSLILKNVTNNDEETYECRCKGMKGRRKKSLIDGDPICIVHLNVTGGDSEDGKDKHQQLGVILTATLIAALVVAVGLVGFVIYKKCKGCSKKKPILPFVDPDVLQQLQENGNSQKNITHNTSDIQM